ncbi:MAG: TMEM165/GDT1 family protein [Thermodesulfobacteriota bacterium]|jgi:putative Ca2+/H+ antiporter (TMEM165/GDT1 family)
MEWKTILATFGLVFLAELGDKTQLATLSFAAGGKHPGSVFLGASLALVLTSLLAVLLGGVLGAWLPRNWVRLGAGAFFIAAGVLILLNRG